MRALSAQLALPALETSPAALFPEPPVLRFASEYDSCPLCGGPLRVLKTRTKRVLALTGPFIAWETVTRCTDCEADHGSRRLASLAPPLCNVAYDVLVFVGRSLFLDHATTSEVRTKLALRNVDLSRSEIDYLGRKFIVCLALAHRKATPRIRRAMRCNGGYILHLDATCDGGSPMLMTGLDAITRIILGSAKIPSEKADRIIPFLQELQGKFGTPAAVVHDMGRGIMNAVAAVFKGVPDFVCHFHFLRDIGKDILGADYATLRKRLAKHALSARLHALINESAATLAPATIDAEAVLDAINGNHLPADIERLPAACAHALARWVLDGKADGHGYGFPFDRPHLVFAERAIELHRALPGFINIFLRNDWRDNLPLHDLSRAIAEAVTDPAIGKAVKELRRRSRPFEQLRDAMRVAPVGGTDGLNSEATPKGMKTIRRRVLAFRETLTRDPDYDNDPKYAKMVQQIDKYEERPFADPIVVQGPGGPILLQPQRTNNILERLFRDLKRAYKRRTGNNTMGRALKAMLAQTPLIKNLENQDYLDMLLEGSNSLAELFAEIDADQVRKQMEEGDKNRTDLPGFDKIAQLDQLPQRIAALFARAVA